ncbi:MAG TPA: hypothetical protein VJU86_19290 [Pyrinomonadaceae bacterium]|nr:hypothetical protein [Pyrinomonadaceae bacterium]
MKRSVAIIFLLTLVVVPAAQGQQDKEVTRLRTRDLLAQLLTKVGPEINITFGQSEKQPFNYLGVLKQGLSHADSFEIVASVTPTNTIGFRIYPYYKGNYINVDKVRSPSSLMRQLLRLSDRAFLFWGADQAGDVFTGYTFTLESGFPEDSIKIVLRSIVNSDRFVGELRPAIDGSVVP